VSRGFITTPPGEGSNDPWSSSSEGQPDEYDEDAAAEWRGAFAAADGGAAGTKEAPCDSPRSMARMQREVQRKLQEQVEVNDRSITIPSSWHADQASLWVPCVLGLAGPAAPAAEDRGAGEVPAVGAAPGGGSPRRPQPRLAGSHGGALGAGLSGGVRVPVLLLLALAVPAAPPLRRQLHHVLLLGGREPGRHGVQEAVHVRRRAAGAGQEDLPAEPRGRGSRRRRRSRGRQLTRDRSQQVGEEQKTIAIISISAACAEHREQGMIGGAASKVGTRLFSNV
jgi:hypothetical protein